MISGEKGTRDHLAGQVAVVTGGGRGIGRAIAMALAESAVRTGVIARSERELSETVALIEESGGHGKAFVADVTDAARIRAVMAEIAEDFGPIKLLVNNAGIVGPIGPFHLTELSEWWRTAEVNLLGTVICSRAVLPGMISAREGRIINIVTSSAAFPYLSSYVTSKTAIMRFTATVAKELQSHGVRMFAVGPGTTRTALSERSLNLPEAQKWIPWFGRIFDEGLDVPVERPVGLILDMASGKADRLSGRLVSVADDLEQMLKGTDEIEEKNLYALEVKKLAGPSSAPSIASIYADAQNGERFTLQLKRGFAREPDELFRLWTDPQAIKKWFVHAADVRWIEEPKLEVRDGGRYSLHVARDGKENEVFRFSGTYREVIPDKKLTFSWNWDSLPLEGAQGTGRTVVRVEFVGQAEGTTIVLTQSGLPHLAAHAAHKRGWERCFDGMEEVLSFTDVEPASG